MWHSKGTGRTLGRKLNKPSPLLPSELGSIPSQSARSRAFASAVDKPTTRVGSDFVAREMYRSRETIVSKIGPRSAPSKWISSITTSATFWTYARLCQLRDMPSHFSGVATMISAASSARRSGVTSPVSSTRLFCNKGQSFLRQSITRSRTSAFNGAMYTTFRSGASRNTCSIASSAETVLPLPVGAPNKTLHFEWYNA